MCAWPACNVHTTAGSHLDDVLQLLLLAEPRLQQSEEQLHKLLAILLHRMVCRGQPGMNRRLLSSTPGPQSIRCPAGAWAAAPRYIYSNPDPHSAPSFSTAPAGHAPRLRARASGAGSTGSRQPCSMARNSPLQTSRQDEKTGSQGSAELHASDLSCAAAATVYRRKCGGAALRLRQVSWAATVCCSPQLLDNWLVRQRLPQRIHGTAEGLVGKQALRGGRSAGGCWMR